MMATAAAAAAAHRLCAQEHLLLDVAAQVDIERKS
jgi:hypothetical protein